MVTPSRIFAPAPIHAPSPIATPTDVRACASVNGPTLVRRSAVLLAALAVSVFVSPFPVYGQSTHPGADDKQFNLLVLGDSIAWGQGLDWYEGYPQLVANKLRQTTGRPVIFVGPDHTLAHSGAQVTDTEGSDATVPPAECPSSTGRRRPSAATSCATSSTWCAMV